MDKNDLTITTYREQFQAYEDKTRKELTGELKEWIDIFTRDLPPGGRVLEIGSAFGRDARYFKNAGLEVLCTDVVPEALDRLSKEGFQTSKYDFRDEPKKEWTEQFDGYFANAVFLHATPETFEQSLGYVVTILKPSGVAAFSFLTGEGEEVTDDKMDAPRYFKYYSPEELGDIFSRFPFDILLLRTTSEGKWIQVIAKRH